MATKPYTTTNGQAADGGQVESNFQEIYSNITNDNIAANAGIDISKTDLGTFTPWTAFTPAAYGGTGSMTFSSVTVNKARYMQIGKKVTVYYDFTGTTGGTTSGQIWFTAPVAPSSDGLYAVGSAKCTDNSTVIGGWSNMDATKIYTAKFDTNAWALMAGENIAGTITYEVA